VLVLDCAGSHTSTAALEMLEQFPLIKAVLIPPKMTSVLQPLDKEFFAPFKKLLKSAVSRYLLQCDTNMSLLSDEERRAYIKGCLT
jgi:hypothetical protein